MSTSNEKLAERALAKKWKMEEELNTLLRRIEDERHNLRAANQGYIVDAMDDYREAQAEYTKAALQHYQAGGRA